MEDIQNLSLPGGGTLETSGAQGQSPDALLSEGESLLTQGDRSGALTRFQSVLKSDPKNQRALLGLAKSTSNSDEAIQALGQVIAADPGNIEARNLRISLQVGTLREGIDASERSYRENPIRRFARPLLFVLVLAAVVAIAYFAKDPVTEWMSEQARAANAVPPPPPPTLAAMLLPPTWTPQPTATLSPTPTLTNTPSPTATPLYVTGRINGTVSARSGPGPIFGVLGTLDEPTAVVLVAISPDGKYYELHQEGDTNLLWVSVAFVSISGGDPSTLPVVSVPTPTPPPTSTKVPYRPPPPPPPRPPTATPALVFKQVKYTTNPIGGHCNGSHVQGTVWNQSFGWNFDSGSGYVPGTIVAVWVNGNYYQDVAGSHPNSYAAQTGNAAYWEIDFPPGQPENGLVGIVDSAGNRLSPQYQFLLNGSVCVITDFSH